MLNISYNEKLIRCEDLELWLNLFLIKDIKYKCIKLPLTEYHQINSLKKDNENARMQIKIRLKYCIKLILIFTVLLLGLIPNFIRLIIPNNLLLKLRRKI